MRENPSIIQKIFIHAPHLIPRLYTIFHDKAIRWSIGKMLTRVVSFPNSGLELMVMKAPDSLQKLFELAEQPENILLSNSINISLKQKYSIQNTLEIISTKAPSLLSTASLFLDEQFSQPGASNKR